MRFIFRADASREIGSGHVMRSSVLAEEIISRGFECIFIGNISGLDWVSERIANLGFSQLIEEDFSFLPDNKSDVLVLDSYSIPVSSEFIAKKKWKLVLSLRDAITPKYESDVELHPGLVSVYSESNATVILSGPEHVLIRKGIEKSRRKKSVTDVPKLLIMGGGSDPFGFVEAIAEVVSSMELNLEVHMFTDSRVPMNSRSRFVRHPIGLNLDLIANDVDIVFTTASTSSLEFIAREIPTGVVCAVDNQRDYYIQLGRLGCALQLGSYDSNGAWIFDLPLIRELLQSQGRQIALKESSRSLIDLKGAARVTDALIKLALKGKY